MYDLLYLFIILKMNNTKIDINSINELRKIIDDQQKMIFEQQKIITDLVLTVNRLDISLADIKNLARLLIERDSERNGLSL